MLTSIFKNTKFSYLDLVNISKQGSLQMMDSCEKLSPDSEKLSGRDWYNLVAEAIADIRNCRKIPLSKLMINVTQCLLLASIFSSKLSKFWPQFLPTSLFSSSDSDYTTDGSGSGSGSGSFRRLSIGCNMSECLSTLTISGDDFYVLESCKHALKEVYRTLKELEAYMFVCSTLDWWRIALFQVDIGDALQVHIHDLLWSVAALDATLHHAKGCTLEVIDAVCSRRFSECYAEMSSLHHKFNECADRKQLITMLTSLHSQFELLSKRKKRTLRVEEENKYRISAYLLHKVQYNADCMGSQSVVHHLPECLSIHPKDIDFSKRRLIGWGSFGQVYEVSWYGIKVAVKELPCGDSLLFKEEASILARLNSPFIVHLIGWSVNEEANLCHLVMELCTSNLRNHIEKRSISGTPPFSLRVAVDIMLQIARGMDYLHSQQVIHRDLRASNILINDCTVREFLDEGHVRVKLCDFGMAKAKLNSSKFFSSMKGASYWRAPEVFSSSDVAETDSNQKKHYTTKADVYSFAMTCYEILTGKIPFDGTLRSEIHQFIMNGGRPELPVSCPTLLSKYIEKCWHNEYLCRPSFKEICKFLRHFKLLLMRIDDPEEVSFQSLTTEFDYAELSSHGHELSSITSGGNEVIYHHRKGIETKGNEEIQMHKPDPRTPKFNKSKNYILLNKHMEVNPGEAILLNSIPCFITKFALHDLRTATANFSVRISAWDYGSVFRGILSDDTVIAVKKVKVNDIDDFQRCCLKVIALGNAYHVNIVHFRGYCVESSSDFLFVFEYMDNLSLDRWITGSTRERDINCAFSPGSVGSLSPKETIDKLIWSIQFKIALGIARGLTFIHEDCGQCILPVGVKLSRILLDKDYELKINVLSLTDTRKNCEFYMHKLLLSKQSSTVLVMSPEAIGAQLLDIYNFGVILLEMVFGHTTIDLPKELSNEDLASLIDGADEFCNALDGHGHGRNSSSTWKTTESSILLASGLRTLIRNNIDFVEDNPESLEKAKILLQISMWCIQRPEMRPKMSQVVQALEGNLPIPDKFSSLF